MIDKNNKIIEVCSSTLRTGFVLIESTLLNSF